MAACSQAWFVFAIEMGQTVMKFKYIYSATVLLLGLFFFFHVAIASQSVQPNPKPKIPPPPPCTDPSKSALGCVKAEDCYVDGDPEYCMTVWKCEKELTTIKGDKGDFTMWIKQCKRK